MRAPGVTSFDDSRVDKKGWAALLYAALTLLLAYPLTINPARGLLNDNPDAHLFMWTLAWDTHAFLTQPLHIFDANTYFPQARTLAYSENSIGSAFFAAPVLWLTGNPVLALNLVILLSVVLCGLGAYVLARRLGIGVEGAILCGLIFAFSPPRFFRIAQLHLTTVQWIPFALAALHAYLDGGRRRDLLLWAAFFTLQVLTTGHGAVFLSLATIGLLAYRAVLGERLALKQRVRDLGMSGAALLAPAGLLFIPYRAVQLEIGLRRSLENWAPTPESFLASPSHVQTWLLSLAGGTDVNDAATAFLFPGYIPLALTAVALWWRGTSAGQRPSKLWARAALSVEVAAVVALAIGLFVTLAGPIRFRAGSHVLFVARDPLRAWLILAAAVATRIGLTRRVPFDPWQRLRRRVEVTKIWMAARRRDMRTYYALLTLVSVWLAAGPPIGLWPLVYWLPGLNFIRAPSRFMILGLLGFAVLAAFGFERLTTRASPRARGLLAAAVGLLLVLEFAAIPLRVSPYQVEIPAVDRWLNNQPKPFAVAELPVQRSERYQTRYMLHSMAHWQKTIHGRGPRSPLHVELYARLRTFPNDASVDTLARIGVDYVVVHTDLYPPGQWASVEERLKHFEARLQLVHAEGGGRVYRLNP